MPQSRCDLVLLFALGGCWRGPVAPPISSAPPAMDEPERLPTSPLDVTDDDGERDQHLDTDGTPWRDIAIVRTGDAHRLVVETSAGRFAMPLDDGRAGDRFVVTELALRPLVPKKRPWVVVVYAIVRDGVRIPRLVACQPGPADNPECARPVDVDTTDLHDAPSWRLVYPSAGGIVVEPIAGGTPRRYAL